MCCICATWQRYPFCPAIALRCKITKHYGIQCVYPIVIPDNFYNCLKYFNFLLKIILLPILFLAHDFACNRNLISVVLHTIVVYRSQPYTSNVLQLRGGEGHSRVICAMAGRSMARRGTAVAAQFGRQAAGWEADFNFLCQAAIFIKAGQPACAVADRHSTSCYSDCKIQPCVTI